MIRKRKHILSYKEVITTPGFKDGNGDYIAGTSTDLERTIICRADVNSTAKTVKNNNGQDYVYSFSIYLNEIPESLKKGMFIEVLRNGVVVGKGDVIMPWEFQSTNIIWI